MDSNKENKRKKDKQEDDDSQRDRKRKKARSKSRSPARMSEKDSRRKRRHSRSRSRDRHLKQEKTDNVPPKDVEPKKEMPERKAKETDMLNTRTGGAYIPPARLRMMQAQITDKSSIAYQRLAWEALKKSIHGHINKINVGNIGIIIKELLKENIVRGRGLLCRSVIQAQAASPTFTNVYAALVAAVNSRFPNIGELLLKRLVIQFKRGFKRNDKPICISSASFIAHLVNQRVAHEILALELLTLLVESPTDDSVEVAIAFLKECGQKLTEVSSKGVNAIFEMLRNILHEGQLDKRVQYMIEVMFQVWKDGFKDHPALIEELELVPEEEQFTHLLMLDDATDPQDILNVFKFDEKYEENEQKYKTLSKEILGSDVESGEEDGSGESGSEESEEEEEEGDQQKPVTIIDNTETNLIALRRTIYLTINSSLDFEECAHKLMKMQLKPGQEVELCHMFLDCCAEQRTYEKFYGLLAQRFCNINRIYIGPFEEIFKDSYGTAHRLDTNRLRNVSKFFAHLLFTDSISWEVLECVKLNEEDTTSSSRIYIKILFQELAEYMGLKKLNDRLKDPTLQGAFAGIFPRDNPKNTRFSINFFTSIGLGGLTDELREHLKQMPKNVPAPVTEINLDSDSDSSSSSSSNSSDDSSSSDSSSSDSESGKKKKKKQTKKDKNKDKTPKTPEEPEKDKNVERWGHDGFYDTYGKDAWRNEKQPDHFERDKDNFVRPRDVSRRNDDRERHKERYESRNNDDRRRRDDRNGKDDDSEDTRSSKEGQNRRDRDQDRRQNDDRNKGRDDEDPRGRRETDKSDRDNDKRRRNDRSIRDDAEDTRRNVTDDKGDKRRDRDQDRRHHDSRNKERDENYRGRKEPEGNDKYSVDRRRDEKNGRDGNEDTRRGSREDKQDRRRERELDGDTDRSKERGDVDSTGRRDMEKNDKHRRNMDYRKDEDSRKNKTDKEERRKNKADEDSDDERTSYRHERQRRDSPDKAKNKNDDKRRKQIDENSDDNHKNKKRGKEDRRRSGSEDREGDFDDKRNKKNSKDKRKEKYRSESPNEYRKEERHGRDKDEDEDDSKYRKSDKKKRDKENKKKEKDDGWDIRRGSSIQRELGGRYWESG